MIWTAGSAIAITLSSSAIAGAAASSTATTLSPPSISWKPASLVSTMQLASEIRADNTCARLGRGGGFAISWQRSGIVSLSIGNSAITGGSAGGGGASTVGNGNKLSANADGA